MKTILIVEDDQLLRQALSKKFQNEGFEVLQAENGKFALNILKNRDVDMITLDLLMPEMDGITFLYNLKNDLKKEIPTIILTNLSNTAYPSTIKEVLVKSNTSIDQVVEKVKKYL